MRYIRDEMIEPIFIGGIVGGVLSSIPIIACLNCCCLLYILSGVITAYLMSKKFNPTDRDYLIAGGLSGSIAGLIKWLGMLIGFVMFGTMVPFMINHCPNKLLYMKMTGTMVPSMMVFSILYFPIYMIIGAIFGAIGGILYGKLKE